MDQFCDFMGLVGKGPRDKGNEQKDEHDCACGRRDLNHRSASHDPEFFSGKRTEQVYHPDEGGI